MTGNRFVAFTALMCHRALLAAALLVTRLAPSGSHLYSIHIWLHAWTDTTLFVDGTQRAIRLDLTASDAVTAQ